MDYSCSKCGLAIIVIPNQEPIRACKCNASIIAEMQSNLIIQSDINKI